MYIFSRCSSTIICEIFFNSFLDPTVQGQRCVCVLISLRRGISGDSFRAKNKSTMPRAAHALHLSCF